VRPLGAAPASRRDTIIGRPPCGCVVSFCTGQGLVSATVSKRKRDISTASAMTASCMAKARADADARAGAEGQVLEAVDLLAVARVEALGMKASACPIARGGGASSRA
jgi:hypothetical protein